MSDPTLSFHAYALSNLDFAHFKDRKVDLSLCVFKDGFDPHEISPIATTSYSKCLQH